MEETNTTASTNIVRNVVDSIKNSDSLLEGLLAYFTAHPDRLPDSNSP